MLQEDPLIVRTNREESPVGAAITAAFGFACGLVVGMVAGEMLGDVRSDRVRRAVGRLRGHKEPPVDPELIREAVQEALREHDVTRRFDITVHAPGAGLIELTGLAPDAVARQAAGDVARAVPGADVVVNRILVNGSDLPPQPHQTTPEST